MHHAESVEGDKLLIMESSERSQVTLFLISRLLKKVSYIWYYELWTFEELGLVLYK